MSEHKFTSLGLHDDLLKNLDSLGYQTMTAVQAKSLPLVLEGRDVIAQAKTGSGKTAAFGLGLLQKLEVKRFRIQSLILCPTRELADQVAKEIRKLARGIHNIKVLTLCGGMPFGPQAGSLQHGAHIIVGTPGRIEDHLGRGTLTLKDVNMLILDEADRMLDMGFQAAVESIIEQIPGKHQTLLFSATFPDQIESMIHRVMNTPALVKIDEVHDDTSIEQHFYQVPDNQYRFTALRLLLLHYSPGSTVIFCNTKKETQDVADRLNEYGFSALALHGDLEQRDRDITLVRFSNKSISILVATDVAARGLDIEELDAVINYHIAHDAEIHTHRIGRTGRAGCRGIACSLYTENEGHKVAMLETAVDPILDAEPLPPIALLDKYPMQPDMVTIRIDGGKKQKVRPGDILGALTGKKGIAGKQVGKINIFENWAYVAVNQKVAKTALDKLMHGKLKGRTFRARLLEGD